MSPDLIIKILEAIAHEAPTMVDVIEGWAKGRKAKRVEEIRPATSFTDQAIAELEKP